MKIFVTGDNHIGLRYASHDAASVLAEARISAFENMIRAANTEGCGLFVITGDLFENTYSIPKRDIQRLLEMLSSFGGVTAVLPGNHDYYDVASKLWTYFCDIARGMDNILLMDSFRPYELSVNGEAAVLYPALCKSLHSAPGENNLGWIKKLNISADSVYRIGVAHGAVEGETIDREGTYFLMRRQELEAIPVDAWLIGHTHVPFPSYLSETAYTQCGRIFNPGTHVQTDVSCGTEGCCFIVEIESGCGQKNVRAKKVVSGNIRFLRKSIAVTPGKLEQSINDALGGYSGAVSADILLSGAVTAEEYADRTNIIEACLSRFIEGTYNDHSLTRQITAELIDSEFAETSFSARLLKALLDDPKEAQLAYELIRSCSEVRK